MKTKLRYQLSGTTSLKGKQLRDKILSKLRDYGYDIVDIREDIIYFDLKGWGLSGNQIGKADGGTVQSLEIANGNTVVLTYYINWIYSFLFLIFLIFFVFIIDWIVLCLVVGLILITFFSMFITKIRHRELLNKIIENTDVR